jgi:hypothetical protein
MISDSLNVGGPRTVGGATTFRSDVLISDDAFPIDFQESKRIYDLSTDKAPAHRGRCREIVLQAIKQLRSKGRRMGFDAIMKCERPSKFLCAVAFLQPAFIRYLAASTKYDISQSIESNFFARRHHS